MISINGVNATLQRLHQLDDALQNQVIKNITHEVFDEVVKGASKHHRTGVMEDNIEMKVKAGAGIVWIDDKNMLVPWRGKKINYASFVLFGTKPHKIVAKDKKDLKWAGLHGFVKSINHPGYKGDNFLQESAKTIFQKVDEIIQRSLSGI